MYPCVVVVCVRLCVNVQMCKFVCVSCAIRGLSVPNCWGLRSQQIMAADGLPAGSLLGRLRRKTTCPKCNERFKQPKLLPCNHSVCRDCLSLRSGVRKGRGLDFIVECPACGKEAELTKSGLDSLPAAFFKEHMTRSFVRLEQVAGGKGCEECGEREVELTSFCRDCERVLCGSCREAHGRLRSLSNHVVVEVGDYTRELGRATSPSTEETRALSVSSAAAMKCSAHGEPLKLYCCTCNSLICHDCTVREHAQPRHKAELVERLVVKHRADLEGGVSVIRGQLTELRRCAAEKEGLLGELVEQKKELCRTLDHIFQELQLELEHRKRKLVREAERKTEEETAKVSLELSRVEKKTSELEGLVQACSEALQHTTDQEFMVLRRDLQARLKEVAVRKPSQSAPTLSDTPTLSLPLSCGGEIESATREVMERSLTLTRAKSQLQKVRSTAAEVGREVQIVFSALAKDGKPCIEPLSPLVRVTVPRFELELNTVIAPAIAVGTYLISFTPFKKGEHLVSVEAGGGEIENSPLRVPVRSSKLDLGQPERVLPKKDWVWGVACCRGDRLVYVTENYNHRVSVWDKDGKLVRSFGQKGQKSGQILHPTGIAVSSSGDVFVADGKDVGRLQKLNRTGQPLRQYVGLSEPHGVTLNSAEDRVFVCENGSQQVAVFDTELNLIETFGELSCSLDEEYEPSETSGLVSPHSIAIDNSGEMYVTDTMGQHVHVYDKTGTHVRSIGHPHDDGFAPSGIAIEDEHIFVADRGGNQVVVMTTAGEFVMATGSYGTASGQFQNPSGVAMDLDGYLYVCDYGNSRLQVF